MGSGEPDRVVVYAGGAQGLELPASWSWDVPYVPGGIRTTHELAFAIAATGRTVELRGTTHEPTFAELSGLTSARPLLPSSSARPEPGTIVINPEGDDDPLSYGRLWLSGARVVALLLAPPGLWGWPFVGGWQRESPLTVDLGALARPEHFAAIAGLGLTMWTHMPHMRDEVQALGHDVTFIGNGDPAPPPPVVPKTVDVVWLRSNRWGILAEQAAAELEAELRVLVLDDVRHEDALAAFSAARVVLFPSRVEGHSRVMTEARARGCVPVALRSNRFATGLSAEGGSVPVDDVHEMAAVTNALLRDPERLAWLSSQARSSAREQLDWASYVARVDGALAAIEASDDPTVEARALIAERVASLVAQREDELREAKDRAADAHARTAALSVEIEELRTQLEHVSEELRATRDRRSIRYTDAAAERVRRWRSP